MIFAPQTATQFSPHHRWDKVPWTETDTLHAVCYRPRVHGHGGGPGPRHPQPRPLLPPHAPGVWTLTVTPRPWVPRPKSSLRTASHEGQTLAQAFQGLQGVFPDKPRLLAPPFSALNMTFPSQRVPSWTQNTCPRLLLLPFAAGLPRVGRVFP